MRLEKNYRGVELDFFYDSVTCTYIGNLEGLSYSVSVQAGDYEDLVQAFHDQVDTYFSGSRPMKYYEAEVERKAALARIAAGSHLRLAAEKPEVLDEDDPYSRRHFLR